MPDARRAHCVICKRHRDECGPISWTGRCLDCARARLAENLTGLDTMTGPAALRWKRSIVRSVGGVLLDDLQPGE